MRNPTLIAAALATVVLAACLPIDRTPVETTPIFDRALAETDRVGRPASGRVLAGAAREDITPSSPVPLAGYGNRLGRLARGVHDGVFARALALGVGERAVILVSVDLLAITDDLTAAVGDLVRRDAPIPPDSLIVTATHTHSGPGAVARRVWESFAAGEYDEAAFKALTGHIARAALAAYRGMEPATIAWGDAEAAERIKNRMIPGGFADPAVPFLAVRRADGRPLAYLVNFSAHATVLKADNFMLSGDFPGAFERALERDGSVALYTAGAVADQTASPPAAADTFLAAAAMGEDLARRVTAALDALPDTAWRSKAELGSWRLEVPLPPAQIKTSPRRRLPAPIADLFFDRRTSLALVVIGDRLLVGVPCDLSAEIGAAWKAQAARLGRRAVILGFANDYVGYVIPGMYYDTSHYEARLSFNGPDMDRYLTAVVARAFERVGRPVRTGP